MNLTKSKSAALFTLLLCTLSVIATPAFAQENDDDKEGALLPNIESQNIEIRGDFKAQFPGLERQPILGFDPSRRIYQFPDDRLPYMETGDDAVADLTLSQFSTTVGPKYMPFDYSKSRNLYTRLGYGSYKSPIGQLWAVLALSNDSYIGLDFDLTSSSEGHIAQRPSTYRYLTGNIEYGVALNETVDLHVFAGLQNDFNYAANFGQQYPNSDNEIPRIEYEGLNIGAKLSGYKNEITGWKLKGEIRTFTNRYKTDQLLGEIDEKVFSGLFSYRWALGHPGETLTVIASGQGGMYEPSNTNSQNWSTLYAGVAYERLFNYKTRLYAEGDLYHISNFAESKVYPGAKISLSHWFGGRLKITGKVEAKPYLKTIEEIHEQNRFLGFNNQLKHSYTVRVNGEASLKWYRGSRLYGGVTYTNTTNYAYFQPTVLTNYGSTNIDAYQIQYGDITNMKIYAGISHQLAPETFWLNGKIYLQNPKLKTDDPVPYAENVGVKASIAYRPIDRITIQGWAKYLGGREAPNMQNTPTDYDLEDIFLVGAQLDVRIADGIGAYVKVMNLLDQNYQYWQGYIERPLQLYGGITITL